ncbi:hypothetical protein TcWFU_009451 [Taenia crassiceps]|uniref:Uncharacterized protein n=1 Tax=Taenia crassiceps TaxID=6207 RepID=A0ABR4Q6P8_9CEST
MRYCRRFCNELEPGRLVFCIVFGLSVMNINSKPPNLLSMTRGQLQLTLEKQLALKDCLSSKLPDSGKKLSESIARIQSILDSKSSPLPPIPPSLKQKNSFVHEIFGVPPTSDEATEEKEDEDRIGNVDDLVCGLVSLHLGPAKCEDAGAGEVEDLSKLPKEPLTPEEFVNLQRLCNLPLSNNVDVLYHTFLLQLRPIESEIVRLVIVDCRNSKNQFVRHGAISTWATEGAPLPRNGAFRCDTVIAAPGPAVAEMWRFVRQDSAMECPVLIADCAASLIRLRRLFCCPSVCHHSGARNTLPRNIRFAVDDGTNSEGKACELKHQQLSGEHLGASLMARTAHYSKLNTAILARLRPKTVAWIEAPLNLSALRAIADMPRGPVTCHPPYIAPSLHEKTLLLKLAATGFNPSSLASLAGQARWHGFAGLLVASGVSRCPEDLANLYHLFRRVYRGLVLNTDLYREDATKPSCSPLWISPVRQLKTLSMKESLEVMTRVRDEIKVSQKEAITKAGPSLPPASAMLLKYREQQAEESDDTLCGNSDDD